jgi:hypothetical protein
MGVVGSKQRRNPLVLAHGPLCPLKGIRMYGYVRIQEYEQVT